MTLYVQDFDGDDALSEMFSNSIFKIKDACLFNYPTSNKEQQSHFTELFMGTICNCLHAVHDTVLERAIDWPNTHTHLHHLLCLYTVLRVT